MGIRLLNRESHIVRANLEGQQVESAYNEMCSRDGELQVARRRCPTCHKMDEQAKQ